LYVKALARALYAKNELVVLDSVSAGLDNNSEEAVFSRVFGPEGILRKGHTTTVFATHAGKDSLLTLFSIVKVADIFTQFIVLNMQIGLLCLE